VFTALPDGELGAVNLTTSQLATRLGKSLATFAMPARALVEHDAREPEETLGFGLVVNRLTDAVGRRDFFSGIHLAHGEGARRRLVEPAATSVAQLRRRAQLQRNLIQLFKSDNDNPGDGERWLAQADDMTRELETSDAVALLDRLAERYHMTGRWELAAETRRMILDRYGTDPQAAQSAHWLLRYYASSEAEWRWRDARRGVARQVTAEIPDKPSEGATHADYEADPRTGEVLPGTSSGLLRRAGRAAAIGTQVARIWPELFARPSLRFALAAAHRHQGLPRQAERYFQTLKLAGRDDAWAKCAAAELWLNEASGVPPLPVWTCAATNSKPYLDGRLDEEMWKKADGVTLTLVDNRKRSTGEAKLRYDAEYLYFAAACEKAGGVDYTIEKQPRPRDADLSQHDRVELLLDIDRDRDIFYRFAIDHRGFCHDSVWGDATWNPKWFVARGGDDQTWVVEAAIRWQDLAAAAPRTKHVWAAQIQRVTPGVGFQSWSSPASPKGTPQGFGLLVFE
ncbi:MAG: hypothetical protein MI757_10100, partial [Pirellulales bacterium]|nr:hypothetical protein [Pirellulales bacterium]